MTGVVKKPSKPIIALGLDPGKENFGWNLIAARSMCDYVSVEDGLMTVVQSQSTEIEPAFLESVIEDVLAKVVLGDVTHVIMERYHPRGTTLYGVEYVNFMIGGIVCALSSLDVEVWLPTASAWKPTVYSNEGWTHLDWFPRAKIIHSGDAGCMALSMLYRRGLIPWE